MGTDIFHSFTGIPLVVVGVAFGVLRSNMVAKELYVAPRFSFSICFYPSFAVIDLDVAFLFPFVNEFVLLNPVCNDYRPFVLFIFNTQ